jgi:hypothetical protein
LRRDHCRRYDCVTASQPEALNVDAYLLKPTVCADWRAIVDTLNEEWLGGGEDNDVPLMRRAWAKVEMQIRCRR